MTDPLALLRMRVLNTRQAEDGEELSRQLAALGAEVLALPATKTAPPDDPRPLDEAIATIALGTPSEPAFQWIGFTSARAVSAFMDRLLSRSSTAPGRPLAQLLAGTKLAAVGPATATALIPYGLSADLVPDRAAGRHLASALGDVRGARILLPRSDIALRDLPESLADRGAIVVEVVVYTTQPAEPDRVVLEKVLNGEVDAATFFSPSALDGFASQVAPRGVTDVLRDVIVVCVGQTTADAARHWGITNVRVPEEASVKGVVRTLADLRRERE
jgi:uroporphyrinogen-III synthase